jgi:predicted RNA-binding Zn-ribbon protein involved in translation (DUF1610 family)
MAPESFAQRLQRLGFKRWYERQLLGSHAHLVLCVFSLLGLVGGFEAFSRAAQSSADKLSDVAAIVASACIGVWSLRQYLQRIAQAEYVANQANCPGCGRYARWTCVASHTDSVDVRCRDCQHGWRIES